MIKFFVPGLLLMILSVGCQTPGILNSQGYKSKKMGYTLNYAKPDSNAFIGSAWKLEKEFNGTPKYGNCRSISFIDKSNSKFNLNAAEYDLLFKNLETNGGISIQSLPLNEFHAHKKLDVMAMDFAEDLSGRYFAPVAIAETTVTGKSKSWATKVVSGEFFKHEGAESYQAVIESADIEQLKLDPKARSKKYKIVLIRPAADNGWIDERKGSLPGLVVLIYGMDFAYYAQYLSDFDNLLKQLRLRSL